MIPYRFQSESEAAFTVFELSGDISERMTKLEDVARPLVGLRSRLTEDWWSFPMVVAYLAIDPSIEGRNGITLLSLKPM